SSKGRKIKIYAPAHKLIVVVPDKTDRKSVVDILRRYLGVLLGVTVVSVSLRYGSIAHRFGVHLQRSWRKPQNGAFQCQRRRPSQRV
ncbi:MAG: hypothetical protein U9Q68_07435, partial [Euryarchaeota archaeon]|nr:hypothetical protein [Euryarchaeota archaeon]